MNYVWSVIALLSRISVAIFPFILLHIKLIVSTFIDLQLIICKRTTKHVVKFDLNVVE